MKKIIAWVFFTGISIVSVHSSPSPPDQRMASYIKVWGFLKYYHPAIGTGRVDADAIFLKYVEDVLNTKDTRAYHAVLTSMFKEIGAVSRLPAIKDTVGLFTRNDRTAWINTEKLLSPAIRGQLQLLRRNGYRDSVHRYLPENFHVAEIPAESALDSIQYPNRPYQLLALARYWNAIEYLFPYKYLIGKDWNTVLIEQLPFFSKPMAPEVFEKHFLQLNASIVDTHGGSMRIRQGAKIYGSYFPPFVFRFAGDSIVVTDFIDSASCARQDIRRGDVVLMVRGKNIATSIKEYEGFISASNLSKKKDFFSSLSFLFPFRGFDSIITVRYLREGQVRDKQVQLQKPTSPFLNNMNRLYSKLTGNGSTTLNDFVLKSINKDIAWVDAANLSIFYNNSDGEHAIDSVMAAMRTHKKAIILDLRCYATQAVFYNKFLPALGWKLQPFAELKAHYRRFPGIYYSHDIYSVVARAELLSRYTGKIILLVNEKTQSQSELITMILQASCPAIVVGAQTAGCDGDLIDLPIPGGYNTSFSGRHVAYIDGTASQQLGVKRDVKVRCTTKGIANEKDEILEAALKLVFEMTGEKRH